MVLTPDQILIVIVAGVAVIPALATAFATVLVALMTQVFAWNLSAETRKRDREDKAEAKLLAIETHKEVLHVGVQAELAYKEANYANLKIQAVQDALSSSLNIPTVPITASTGANDRKEEK